MLHEHEGQQHGDVVIAKPSRRPRSAGPPVLAQVAYGTYWTPPM